MRYIITILIMSLGLVSCSNNSVQCRKLKPLKQPKYRVKSTPRKKVGNYTSVSTQTGKVRQTPVQVAPAISTPTPERPTETAKKPTPVVEKTEDKPTDARAENQAQEIEVIKEKLPVNETIVEAPVQKEKLIHFTSNIEYQSFEALENQSIPFDSKRHIQFNNKKFEFITKNTFYQRIQFKEDLKNEVDHVELGTVLNNIALKPTQNIKIHTPSKILFLKNGAQKEYNIIHFTEGDNYEIYNQALTGLDNLIEEKVYTDLEIYNELKEMLRVRSNEIKQYLIKKGIPASNISIEESPSLKNIVIEAL